MSENPIGLTAPTSRAWARMKRILFAPFDLGKWFALGFTAWLATMFEGGGSGGGGDSDSDSSSEGGDGTEIGGMNISNWEEAKGAVAEWIDTATAWMQDNSGIVMLIGGLVLFVIVIVVVLYWVSCRGKFMFLDNVVWNRALIGQPWKDYKRQGNSLFWWSIGFGIFTSLIFLAIFGGAGWYAFTTLEAGNWIVSNTIALAMFGLGLFLFVCLCAYIGMLLENFVIPVMYQNDLTTTQAWMRFLPLHNRRVFRFVLFAIWKFLLTIVAVIAIFVVGLGTCCIGFILMILPYIGAVVLLPMTVFFRSLGLEFLAQFGGEWDVLEELSPPLA